MSDNEKLHHTLLEEALIMIRKYTNKYTDKLDDEDLYAMCVLIRNIEQHI